MIKSITPGSQFITVHHSGPTNYVNNSGPAAGMMRYNVNTQDLEVFDGRSWVVMTSYATVDLPQRVKDILEWAEQQMLADRKLQALAEEHPAVKAAVAKFNEAQEQLKIIVELSVNQ